MTEQDSEDELRIAEIRFGGDLIGPLAADDDIDGQILLKSDTHGNHNIPFGEKIPESGAKNKRFAVWSWDGDRENPTLSPSIDMADFHIWIRNGEVKNT